MCSVLLVLRPRNLVSIGQRGSVQRTSAGRAQAKGTRSYVSIGYIEYNQEGLSRRGPADEAPCLKERIARELRGIARAEQTGQNRGALGPRSREERACNAAPLAGRTVSRAELAGHRSVTSRNETREPSFTWSYLPPYLPPRPLANPSTPPLVTELRAAEIALYLVKYPFPLWPVHVSRPLPRLPRIALKSHRRSSDRPGPQIVTARGIFQTRFLYDSTGRFCRKVVIICNRAESIVRAGKN